MIYAKVISILYKTSGKGKEMGVSGTYNTFLYTTTLVMATSEKKFICGRVVRVLRCSEQRNIL